MSAAANEGHDVWSALEQTASWSNSLFVVYVFAPTPGQARTLAAQMRLNPKISTLDVRQVASAGELEQLATQVQPMLEELSRPIEFYGRPVLWIDGSLEFEADGHGAWRRAWGNLIARLNERRELLRETLRGLVLIGPPQAQREFAVMGPDLWSIRSLARTLPRPTLDVPGPATFVVPRTDAGTRAVSVVSPDIEPTKASLRERVTRMRASARLARASASIEPLRVGDDWRRATIDQWTELERGHDEVISAWIEQVETAAGLGEYELASEWLEQLEQRLAGTEPDSPREAMLRVAVTVLAGELSLEIGAASVAKQRLNAALAGLAGLAATSTPYDHRIALGLARALRELGQLDEAKQQCERALSLERSVAGLRELAGIALAGGEVDRAASVLREALPLARSLAEQVGVRREFAAALMLGAHWPAARQALDDALALALAEAESALVGDCRHDLRVWQKAMSGVKSSLVILHLSDLHFGPHSRFGHERPQQTAERFGLAIERHREAAGFGKIDLVVVSGDLTQTARADEFKLARRFCEALNGRFGLGRDRWVFVPGNHDLSWPHIRLARAEQGVDEFDDEELARRIHEYKFRNYSNFIDEFYEQYADDLQRAALHPAGWIHDIPELQVSLGLLNSSELTTDVARAGELTQAQAQALLSQWRARPEPMLRVIVVHHNPQEVDEVQRAAAIEWFEQEATKKQLGREVINGFIADNFGLEGKELLEQVATQAQVPLVLHGHVHSTPRRTWEWPDGERRTHVLAAGSGGAGEKELPGDQPNSLQLIEIELATGKTQVLRLRYAPKAPEPGRVDRGTFVGEAEELGGTQTLRLALPERFRSEPVTPSAAASPAIDRNFWREYRARLAGRFETWGFGTRQRGSRQASVVTLDDMYLPLRVDAGYDQNQFEAGQPITVDDLLGRKRGLIVRGGPGSGKTTWLRWLFRRMVERDDVLPIFIELRALAKRWTTVADEPRNFDDYLSVWLAEAVGKGWEQPFRAALHNPSPRPILLIDGWDELGDLGRELGQQLVKLSIMYPQVLVVATSRPYGEGVSELASRFDELQLQPMSDEEVVGFVRNFYERVHRSEASRIGEEVDRFLANLTVNPQARALGRTPLLLVMLLMIGRDRPLPDQRHELYRMCIEDLLDARPKQRQALGVLQGSWEWAPERYAERLQAAAKLAWSVQANHLAEHSHKRPRDALATREQLTRELEQWDPHERDCFVTWLVNGAGLLIEREDGKLQFAHLGFQEYLAAWHLDATHEGKLARLEAVQTYAENTAWWEVARLWAAIVESKAPAHLDEVARELIEQTSGFWLVGAMLADGLGSQVFAPWSSRLHLHFGGGEWHFASACAGAWKICQQDSRRNQIAKRLEAGVPAWTWLERQRADMWREACGLEHKLLRPPKGSPAAWIQAALDEGPWVSEQHAAWGRVWMSTSPMWGADSIELLGLRLWPTRRSWLGWVIQSAVGFGMSRDDVLTGSWHELLADRDIEVGMSLAMDIARDIAMPLAMDIARDIAMYLARDIARDIARNIARDIAKPDNPTMQDLAHWILFSANFAGTRAILAHSPSPSPLATLLSTACKHSLDPTLPPFTAPPFTGDPLWPALARHVARVSTEADRTLLLDYIKDPDAHTTHDPTRWGLRYWVRGDIMFADGSVITLDEIWTNLRARFPDDPRLAELPLLDEYPPDIDREALELAIKRARK